MRHGVAGGNIRRPSLWQVLVALIVCALGSGFGGFVFLQQSSNDTAIAALQRSSQHDKEEVTDVLRKVLRGLKQVEQSQQLVEEKLKGEFVETAAATALPLSSTCPSLASSAIPFVNTGSNYSAAMAPEHVSGHGVIAASCKPGWNYVWSEPMFDKRGPQWLENAYKSVSTGKSLGKHCGYDWKPSLHNVFPKGQCGLVVDVGANIGLAVAPAASLGWRVLAFEPIPQNVEQLRLNLFLNGWTADQVGLVHTGVSESFGNATIYAPEGREDNTAMSRTAATRNVGGKAKEFSIPLVSLDDYFAGASPDLINDVRLIKVDTQGHEIPVLRGAQRLLSEGPRQFLLFVEVDHKLQKAAGYDPEDVLKFMRSVGWKACCDAACKVVYTSGKCYDVVFRFF